MLKELFSRLDTLNANLTAGFAGCGIYPMNRNAVLSKLPGRAISTTISQNVTQADIESSFTRFLSQQRGFTPDDAIASTSAQVNDLPAIG